MENEVLFEEVNNEVSTEVVASIPLELKSKSSAWRYDTFQSCRLGELFLQHPT